MFNSINVKKLVLGLILLMVGSFTLAGTIFFTSGEAEEGNNHGFIIQGKYSKDINETKTLELSGLKNMDIESTSTDITLLPSNDSTIKAHLHGVITSSNKNYFPTLEVEQNGDSGKITVKWPEVITVGYMNNNIKLDVYIPKAYQQNLGVKVSSAEIQFAELTLLNFKCSSTSGDMKGKLAVVDNAIFKSSSGRFDVNIRAAHEFSMESTSGDFISNEIQVDKFTRKTSSGSTIIDNLSCTDFKYTSTTGDLKLAKIEAVNSNLETSSGTLMLTGKSTEKVQIKTTSGDTSWQDMQAKAVQFDTSTGETNLSGLAGDLTFKSTSGDADLEFSKLEGKVKVEASSGEIKLKLPEDSEFGLDLSTSSGSLNVESFEVIVKGKVTEDNLSGYVRSERNEIDIETRSGDITLLQN